ncbi:MAG: PAS-domain containing protein, partial [Alphaproteobacteria bacterium]|nr:PAS-domain containing protein [Alphaproteobacteria bacterium]
MALWDGIDFCLGIAAVTALAAGPAYLCARWRAARQPADQRLTELLETLPSAVAVFDPADRLVQANDQLLRLLTDLRATIRSGQSRREVFTQLAEAGVFAEAIGRVESFVDDIMWLSTNGDSDWEANLTDGRCLHFRERVGSNGQRLVTCLDITTQKRQSWELEEKSTMLRTTLDSIDQGLLVFGPDFRLVNWNDQFFKLNGIDPAIAAVGLSLHDLITHFAEKGLLDANPGGEAVDERVRSVMRCEPPQLNARLPSGRVLDLRRRPMPAGGVAITCTDITDLENREEALKRRSAELEAIFGNMDEGLAVIEKNLDIVAMNERHLELLEL